MAIKTAQDVQASIVAVPTDTDLTNKYYLIESLITTAAADGLYTFPVTIGTRDQTEFVNFIKSYGYRATVATDQDSEFDQVRKIVGTPVNLIISWQTFTVVSASATALEGQSISYTITTKGVANGTTLYWSTGGTTNAADFTPQSTQGSFQIQDGTGTVSIAVRSDGVADANETVIFNVYADSLRTDLVATAAAVTVT
jgi:hypothetical protein